MYIYFFIYKYYSVYSSRVWIVYNMKWRMVVGETALGPMKGRNGGKIRN